MGDGAPTTGVIVETLAGEGARELAPVVSGLYEAVFSLPPFSGDAAEFENQRRYYPAMTGRPGFRLTVARVDHQYVGYGYGYLLPADTHWWQGLAEPVSEDLARETGHRTFAIIDYGVLSDWRGRGVGHAIHDKLLAGCGAERATLSVQPKAEETQAIYRRWGWRKVSSIEMDPPVPAPGVRHPIAGLLPPRVTH